MYCLFESLLWIFTSEDWGRRLLLALVVLAFFVLYLVKNPD
jgi:hypothetical protein